MIFLKDRSRRWRKAREENVWDYVPGRLETDLLRRKGVTQRKGGRKFWSQMKFGGTGIWIVTLTLWQHVWNVQVQTRWTWKWIRRELLVEIWEFGSLPGKRFRGWVKRVSWSHAHHTSRTPPKVSHSEFHLEHQRDKPQLPLDAELLSDRTGSLS